MGKKFAISNDLRNIIFDGPRQDWLMQNHPTLWFVSFIMVTAMFLVIQLLVYNESLLYRDSQLSLALIPFFLVPVSLGFSSIAFSGSTMRMIMTWSWIAAIASQGIGRVLITVHCNSMQATGSTWPFSESSVDRFITESFWCDGSLMFQKLMFELTLFCPLIISPCSFLANQFALGLCAMYYLAMGIIGRNGEVDSSMFMYFVESSESEVFTCFLGCCC